MKPILWFNVFGPFIYYLLLSFLPQNNKREYFFYLLFVHIFIFQAFFSYLPFPDIPWYNDAFDYLRNCSLTNFIQDTSLQFEIGYLAFTKLIATFFSDVRALYIARSIIVAYCVTHFIRKHTTQAALPAVFYFMFFGYEQSIFVVRQYLAISIYLIAMDYIIEKKQKYYLLFWMLSFGFHKSAIIFFPLYYLYWMNITKRKVYLLLLVSIVTVLVFRQYSNFIYPLLGLYDTYTSNLNGEGSASAGMLLRVVVLFVPFMFFCKEKILSDNYGKLIFYILLADLFISILIIGVASGSRLYTNYAALSILVVPYVSSNIESKVIRNMYRFAMLAIFVGLYINAGDEYGYMFMWE